MNYLNFDLEFSPTAGNAVLRARVLQSPAGESGYADISWPFSAGEERELVRNMFGGLAMRSPFKSDLKRRVESFGGRLFDAVFVGQIDDLYRESQSRLMAGQCLRVRLRLPEGLLVTPWEYMFDRKNREFPAAMDHSAVVRYLETPKPAAPITVEGPLRVLVAISAPTDHPRLDADHEWKIICEALKAPIQNGQIALDRVAAPCTFNHLRDALKLRETHVFHFVGHGVPGALIFEGDHGEGIEMDSVRLRSAFPGQTLPRLIVLNSCAGALGDEAAGLASLAHELMRQGAPAVLGMQAAITDKAAIRFTRYFYTELVSVGAVDAALTEARIRLSGEGNLVEWGIPVLYMRAVNGVLFRPGAGRVHAPDPKPDPPPGERGGSKPDSDPLKGSGAGEIVLDGSLYLSWKALAVAVGLLAICVTIWWVTRPPPFVPAAPVFAPSLEDSIFAPVQPTCDDSNVDEQPVECLFVQSKGESDETLPVDSDALLHVLDSSAFDGTGEMRE